MGAGTAGLVAATRLLEAGEAYEAFSTPEEVEARHLAAGRNPKLGYDNFDRDLTEGGQCGGACEQPGKWAELHGGDRLDERNG